MKWATLIIENRAVWGLMTAAGLCLAVASTAVAKDGELPPLESLVVEAPDPGGVVGEGDESIIGSGSAAAEAGGSNPSLETPLETPPVETRPQDTTPFDSSSIDSTVSDALTPGRKRVVELPEDFAAPDRRTVVIPDRPAWVDRKPGMVGDDYCISVSSALALGPEDCRPSLNEQLEEAVQDYVADFLGSSQASYFINFDLTEIRSRLVAKDEQHQEFSDIVEVSLGPMHQSHAMLRITPEFRSVLEHRWTEIRQTGRVLKTAGASVGVLALLVTVFGYFRLDSATKGYYTRRLQMLLVAAILAVVALGVVYFRNTAELIYRFTV